MKRSRPLSLFLSVLILISCFTVSVSASDNLIDPALTNWDTLDDNTKVVWTNGYYQLQIRTIELETGNICIGAIYDLSSLNAGYSYKLNFHLLSGSEMGLTDSRIYNQLNNGPLVIGLASYDSSTNQPYLVDGCYVEVTKDNYSKYFGYDTSFTFTLPNVENPCICIYYLGLDNTVFTFFGFKNVSLIDTEAEKEQGFLDKLFTWFQEKFNAIGESFTNLGNKLTELKNSFLDSLSNLGDTIGSFFDEQLSGIKEFFRGFGNLILYFNWEGEYTNPFEREDSPIDKVSEFFDNLIEYVDSIGTSIENVLDSITGGLDIFDRFTSRFPWLKGIAVFCLALIVITRFIGL